MFFLHNSSPTNFSTLTLSSFLFFFFNDTATTEIYTLSLHDALPICCGCHRHYRSSSSRAGARSSYRAHSPRARRRARGRGPSSRRLRRRTGCWRGPSGDRKSTRLNSSHDQISYAVFCLKKKKKILRHTNDRKRSTTKTTPDKTTVKPISSKTNRLLSQAQS